LQVLKLPLNGPKERPARQRKPSEVLNPIVGDILRFERQFEVLPYRQDRQTQVMQETTIDREHIGTVQKILPNIV
jgi:hypothetical protein